MTRRRLAAALLLALLLPALAACGKKSEPLSPSGSNTDYFRKYPAK